ncbi:hypothetical protein M0R04_13920 [Candidatus Dojkabacteria bacterium]|jgi:hypothetical protein|nr:hypothetical protein [Candidatus Dojkabacteria bacterium]
MKIPDQLKIGGHIVKVELIDLGESLDGEFDSQKNRIALNSKLPPSQMEASLLHEILHACNAGFSGDDSVIHVLMESISQQLYQVLKDNDLLK